ncbi:hypothetical protein SEVIR_9G120001v4 [Setaria viridis]
MILALFFIWLPAVDINYGSVHVASGFCIPFFQLEALVIRKQ